MCAMANMQNVQGTEQGGCGYAGGGAVGPLTESTGEDSYIPPVSMYSVVLHPIRGTRLRTVGLKRIAGNVVPFRCSSCT